MDIVEKWIRDLLLILFRSIRFNYSIAREEMFADRQLEFLCIFGAINRNPSIIMSSFWDKTKVFFESRGWRIFWSLFVIAVFVNLFVQTLHRPLDWFRVVLLITLPILVIRRVFEFVQAIKSKTKDQ